MNTVNKFGVFLLYGWLEVNKLWFHQFERVNVYISMLGLCHHTIALVSRSKLILCVCVCFALFELWWWYLTFWTINNTEMHFCWIRIQCVVYHRYGMAERNIRYNWCRYTCSTHCCVYFSSWTEHNIEESSFAYEHWTLTKQWRKHHFSGFWYRVKTW